MPGLPVRFGQVAEYAVHEGCVNRLAWSSDGRLLASGSDDLSIAIQSFEARPGSGKGPIAPAPYRMRRTDVIPSGHSGNIFGVKFLPDDSIVSGAMDGEVRWHARSSEGEWESRLVYTARERIKNVETASDSPYLFWAAVEDGTILQFDTRTIAPIPEEGEAGDPTGMGRRWRLLRPASGTSAAINRNAEVLISLRVQQGGAGSGRTSSVEMKSVVASKANPYHLVVAASDQYVRMYDRRMLPRIHGGDDAFSSWRAAHANVLRYCPLHLAPDCTAHLSQSVVADGAGGNIDLGPLRLRTRHVPRTMHTTYAEFDSTGRHIVASYHGDCVYQFDALCSDGGAEVTSYGAGTDVAWWKDDVTDVGVSSAAVSLAGTAKESQRVAAPVACDASAFGTDITRSSSSGGLRQPSPSSTTSVDAMPASVHEAKDFGNSAFRSAHETTAVRFYSEGIAAGEEHLRRQRQKPWGLKSLGGTPPSPTVESGGSGNKDSTTSPTHPLEALYANRATAHLKRGLPSDASVAVADCLSALALSPGYWKVELKLAKAAKAANQLCFALEMAERFKARYGSGQAKGGGTDSAQERESSGSFDSLPGDGSSTGTGTAASGPSSTEVSIALQDADGLIASIRTDLSDEALKLAEQRRQLASSSDSSSEQIRGRTDSASSSGSSGGSGEWSYAAVAAGETGGRGTTAAASAACGGIAMAPHLEHDDDSDIFAPLEGRSEPSHDRTESQGLEQRDLLSSGGASAAAPVSEEGGGYTATRRDQWVRTRSQEEVEEEEEEEEEKEADADDDVFGDAPSSPLGPAEGIAVASSTAEGEATAAASGPFQLRNPWPGYPLSHLHNITSNNPASSANASTTKTSGFGGPLWEADPQLLCTRHSLQCAGVRNVQTDIKEAAFWEGGAHAWDWRPLEGKLARELGGPRDASISQHRNSATAGFIVAGSDGGHILVWERATGMLVAALPDDDDVTNCVRPHPTLPLLASSGIGHTVRLWAPAHPDVDAELEAEQEDVMSPSQQPTTASAAGTAPGPQAAATAAAQATAATATKRVKRGPLQTAVTDQVTLDHLVQSNLQRSAASVSGPAGGGGIPSAVLRRLVSSLFARGGVEASEDDDDDEGEEEGEGAGTVPVIDLGGVGQVRCAQQ